MTLLFSTLTLMTTLALSQPASTGESTEPSATPTPAPIETPTEQLSPTPENRGPVLWQNIRSGMPADEVRRLYPERDRVRHHREYTEIDNFPITEQCRAEINIRHETGFVDTVVLKGNPSLGGRCSDTILTTLSSRHGQPLSDTRTESSILAREGRIYVWNRNGVTLRFKRFTSGAFSGGGLGGASWELTYTTVADEAAL